MTTAHKAITFKNHSELMKILEQKETTINSKNSKTHKLELNKIRNLKVTITILSCTGAKIGQVQKMKVKHLKEIILHREFENITMTQNATELLASLLKFYTSDTENSYLIRKHNQSKPLSKNHLMTITNLLLKELGDNYSTSGFKQNIMEVYGISERISMISLSIGVTTQTAKRLCNENRKTFKIQ